MDDSRRNRNLRIQCGAGGGFFVKRADPSDPSTMASVTREACLYRHLGAKGHASIKRLLPRFYLHDKTHNLLVLELLSSAEPLGRRLDAAPFRPQPALARAIGRTLGKLQSVNPELQAKSNHGVPAHFPWPLQLSSPNPELLRIMTPGQVEVIRAIQADAGIRAFLEELRRSYGGLCLVHGDVRWDNLLREKRGRREVIRLIDWELSGRGDPAWDPGSAIACLLVRCVCLMEPGRSISPSSVRKAFTKLIPDVQREIRAFWQGFCEKGNASCDESQFVLRVGAYCGARLLQAAYEWSLEETISPVASCFLQLGMNILKTPGRAVSEVLGLGGRAVIA